jgi:hypothetical protein
MAISEGRLRAVVDLLMSVTIEPVGTGSRVFNHDRVLVDWRS